MRTKGKVWILCAAAALGIAEIVVTVLHRDHLAPAAILGR